MRHRQRAEQLDQELSSTRVTNKELNEKIEELQAKLNKNNVSKLPATRVINDYYFSIQKSHRESCIFLIALLL